ncbi:hypothetical protein SAMN05444671_4633 [Flavobacterium sp. CF108]|uniref:hypothetical protein n=1 Tax=unclassified Flavobacterium TaxID=196869 RepID=UPI0008D5381E|nr:MULTISPECIES: hypothetical protein [unclassified Flavobacterium]SEP22772.1 hypothetical protein SAMN04487978_0122 [Flavobacterium sp. fv08]SHI00086.1 hypothetical protein SAMN05444671_4633 [Flavobacterium sp. CF108]
MKKNNLNFLKNKTVINIYKVSIREDNSLYDLSDTLILRLKDNSIIQIIIDYEISIYELSSIDNLIIIGDYDLKNIEVTLIELNQIQNDQIVYIHNYSQSAYHFGSKFLNINNEFIFGFCFGWDEIVLLNEKDFVLMLNSYEDKVETIV